MFLTFMLKVSDSNRLAFAAKRLYLMAVAWPRILPIAKTSRGVRLSYPVIVASVLVERQIIPIIKISRDATIVKIQEMPDCTMDIFMQP